MSLRPLLAVLACLLLAGCVEAEEVWTLDGEGGGTYALSVQWDADLWRRVGEVLGPTVMRRFADPGFPLRAAQWRDGLRGLAGVEIVSLEETAGEGGARRIATTLKFRRVEDVLRWELLAGRRVRIQPPDPAGGDRPVATWAMEPLARVPILDAVAAVAEAEARPPPPAGAGPAELDPPPLARLGLDRTAAGLVAAMLRPALERAVLRVRLELPGRVVGLRGQPAGDVGPTAAFSWSFADLRLAATDRTVRCRWEVRDIDRVPAVDAR